MVISLDCIYESLMEAQKQSPGPWNQPRGWGIALGDPKRAHVGPLS